MLTRPAGPALATTYEGGDPALYERVAPFVSYLEIAPDSISRLVGDAPELDTEAMAELADIGTEKRFLVHGVGLSIASADAMSESYLRLLDGVFERLPVAWHSEHLGYTRVEGVHLGTMLPPPRTQEALELICERALRLRARYGVPFLLEHIVRVVPDCPGEYTEASFLNTLSRESGCGLIVDAHNLVCDRENFSFDVDGFLDEIDFSHVREMHIAGGVLYKGFRVDSHTRRSDDATRALALDILARAPDIGAVTFEFLRDAIAVLGHDGIGAELQDLARTLVHAQPL